MTIKDETPEYQRQTPIAHADALSATFLTHRHHLASAMWHPQHRLQIGRVSLLRPLFQLEIRMGEGRHGIYVHRTIDPQRCACRSSLITRGNDKLDNMFIMRDTLLCYTTTDITPLYYRKGAREGKRYYVDELWYSYPKGNSHLKMHRIDADGKHHWKQAEYKDCIYDMMSIFLRARNFDTSKLRKGENIPMPISDARHLSNSWLKYGGKTTLKMKNSNAKFRCLIFSFIEREDGKNHELIRFFVTDDKNHLPVRLDMFLSFGSAKAYLTGMKGLRNELTSKEK